MKNLMYKLGFLLFLLSSCTGKAPPITCLSCDVVDQELEPQDRRVIIEEFTGVRCVHCPAGSAEIKNLQRVNGKRLIAISIHAGFNAPPYLNSLNDFRTDAGTNILNLLEEPLGFPSAVINRKLYGQSTELQTGQGNWAGAIDDEKVIDAKIGLSIDYTWNAASRELTASIRGVGLEKVSDEIALTAHITESGIEDYQLTEDGIQADYIHNHALRATLSNFTGDQLTNALEVDETFEKSYTYLVPGAWDINHCSIVAYVHEVAGNKYILQGAEKHIEE